MICLQVFFSLNASYVGPSGSPYFAAVAAYMYSRNRVEQPLYTAAQVPFAFRALLSLERRGFRYPRSNNRCALSGTVPPLTFTLSVLPSAGISSRIPNRACYPDAVSFYMTSVIDDLHASLRSAYQSLTKLRLCSIVREDHMDSVHLNDKGDLAMITCL